MSAGTPFIFIPAKNKILKAGVNFTADALKVALFTSSLVLSQDFLGGSGDCRYADMSANEVANGNGYATGGVAVTGATIYNYVASATVAAAGTGGTNGAQTVTGTTGTGTKFQAGVTVTAAAISAVNSISTPGAYTALPTAPGAEPVTGGGLTGAQLNLTMGSFFDINDPQWTGASFTAKWAVLYDNTSANKDAICGWDLETTIPAGLTPIAGTLEAVINSSFGLFTLT